MIFYFILLMSRPRLRAVAQATIFAALHHIRTLQADVFQWVSEGASTAITDRHLPFNFDDRNFLDKLKRVRTMLSKLEFGLLVCASM
jgi:hypothetical protein